MCSDPKRHRDHQRTYAAENRPREIARVVEWRRQNPDRLRMNHKVWNSNRRALLLGWPSLRSADVAALAQSCAYCGRTDSLTLDHKTPLSRGGSHAIENIVLACRSCNSRKHTRTYEEFWPTCQKARETA